MNRNKANKANKQKLKFNKNPNKQRQKLNKNPDLIVK
jgi:hypothetical protein